jgi:hypothetical protein
VHDPSDNKIALACGAAGAFVDVTDDVVTDSISRQWGRGSEFDDARPGVFSFTFKNDSGKYTPGNTASSLATPLVEGMGVCWVLDGSLRSGNIRSAEPQFVQDVSGGTYQVRVVVDDMLSAAGRRRVSSLSDGIISAAYPYFYFPLNDDGPGARDAYGQLTMTDFGFAPEFGVTGVTGDTQIYCANGGLWTGGINRSFSYDAGSRGFVGAWITSLHDPVATTLRIRFAFDGPYDFELGLKSTAGAFAAYFKVSTGTASVPVTIPAGIPTHVAIGLTYTYSTFYTYTLEVFVNGVSAGTDTINHIRLCPASIIQAALFTTAADSDARFSHFFHTRDLPRDDLAGSSILTDRIRAFAAAAPEITLDTLPIGLSLAPLGWQNGQYSVLDAFSDLLRTEQGHIYTETTGTLTAPVQVVKVRERDRTETVTASFSMSEILYAPEFVRDISNMVSLATAIGPENSANWSDADLTQYVGSASARDNVLLRDQVDLLAWAQDRIIRGKNVSVRIAQFTIDALSTPTNRWADLTGLVPGDRIQITGLPSTQIGFDTLEGWLLGGGEAHDYPHQMLFTFNLQPVLPPTGIYDHEDRRYMAGGVLSLDADIDASDTTMDIVSADGRTKFTTDAGDLPLVIVIGDEHLEITACTSATPQVATITRGVDGTTAASHTAGDLIELATDTLYAF